MCGDWEYAAMVVAGSSSSTGTSSSNIFYFSRDLHWAGGQQTGGLVTFSEFTAGKSGKTDKKTGFWADLAGNG